MADIQNYQRVTDYVKYAQVTQSRFLIRFPHPFLVLVEFSGHDPEEDTDDFFTGTRTQVEIDSLLDIARGRRLDPAAIVFPVLKRPRANPYSGLVTIGRATNCDIVINVNGVSKFHAYLAQSLTIPGDYLAGDGSSKNGTLINGRLIDRKKRYELNNGDRISLSTVAILRYFTPGGFWEILQR